MAVLGTKATRIASVRRLAGNLTSTDISDADTEAIIERWDEWAQAKTNKTNWTSTDFGYKLLLAASDLMSSAEVLDGIPTPENTDKAAQQRVSARDSIKSINKKDDEVQAQDHTDAVFADVNLADELNEDFYTKTQSDTY